MKEEIYNSYIGQTFDNQYRIIKTIGIGGMAVVFEAIDIHSGERVAIKMLKDSIENDNNAIRRFINESKAISMLNSNYIVKINHISVDGPHKFIVMEYIDGVTLREYMNHIKIVNWHDVIAFSEQILLALSNAHGQGIVHRDIKPQNIMIKKGGSVKVMDFGIAKIPKAETLTMVDKAIGTVYYISPEQARNRQIDARSDLYSLGVLMYEMVAGKLPFVADTAIAVLMAHISEVPKAPSQFNPSIPKGLEQVILRLLEKDPENRYQSAGEVFRALRQIQENPAVVLPSGRPPKTPTAEQSIKETLRHQEMFRTNRMDAVNQKQQTAAPAERRTMASGGFVNSNRPVARPTTRTQTLTNLKNTAQNPRDNRENAPFAFVVLICIIFLALALVGLGILFGMAISNGSVKEAIAVVPSVLKLGKIIPLYL